MATPQMPNKCSSVQQFNSAPIVTSSEFNQLQNGTQLHCLNASSAIKYSLTLEYAVKVKLIEKVLERTNDLDIQEAVELVGLDIHEIVEDAIQRRLERMTEDELLELL